MEHFIDNSTSSDSSRQDITYHSQLQQEAATELPSCHTNSKQYPMKWRLLNGYNLSLLIWNGMDISA